MRIAQGDLGGGLQLHEQSAALRQKLTVYRNVLTNDPVTAPK